MNGTVLSSNESHFKNVH